MASIATTRHATFTIPTSALHFQPTLVRKVDQLVLDGGQDDDEKEWDYPEEEEANEIRKKKNTQQRKGRTMPLDAGPTIDLGKPDVHEPNLSSNVRKKEQHEPECVVCMAATVSTVTCCAQSRKLSARSRSWDVCPRSKSRT